MDRRTFLKTVGAAGAALAGAEVVAPAFTAAQSSTGKPNILFIMVDQLRYPQWFPATATLDAYLPNLARLRKGAVSFAQHYTASNACTPARACLLTGLYTHQTGCLFTQEPGLHSDFPTWGTALRTLGYKTNWYGKWHLNDSCNLDPYGFSGGTCPSPNGAPGLGLAKDALIADQFVSWLQSQGGKGPWCTAVSFVNPHDIAYFYRYSSLVPGERTPPRVFSTLPANFETPDDFLAQQKPGLQHAFQVVNAKSFGNMPFIGPNWQTSWLVFLDLYLQLQTDVDTQIGRVLDALEAEPGLAKRTIVVFTSDHGEYAGSHGMRGKGGGAYDEAIRVPLYVKDPTGAFTRKPEIERTQLTSSVDIAALLLTLASGNTQWRSQKQHEHLKGRLDLAAILRDPKAKGRSFVLHTTDEMWTKDPQSDNSDGVLPQGYVPNHVVAYRSTKGKIATYSFWKSGSLDISTSGQQAECYDYSTSDGRMEMTNVAPLATSLYSHLSDTLVKHAIPNELRQPLPKSLSKAQQSGFHASVKVMAKH